MYSSKPQQQPDSTRWSCDFYPAHFGCNNPNIAFSLCVTYTAIYMYGCVCVWMCVSTVKTVRWTKTAKVSWMCCHFPKSLIETTLTTQQTYTDIYKHIHTCCLASHSPYTCQHSENLRAYLLAVRLQTHTFTHARFSTYRLAPPISHLTNAKHQFHQHGNWNFSSTHFQLNCRISKLINAYTHLYIYIWYMSVDIFTINNARH